jgi:hypothetical protein
LRWVSAPLLLGIRLLLDGIPAAGGRRDTYAEVRPALLCFKKYSIACVRKQARREPGRDIRGIVIGAVQAHLKH